MGSFFFILTLASTHSPRSSWFSLPVWLCLLLLHHSMVWWVILTELLFLLMNLLLPLQELTILLLKEWLLMQLMDMLQLLMLLSLFTMVAMLDPLTLTPTL